MASSVAGCEGQGFGEPLVYRRPDGSYVTEAELMRSRNTGGSAPPTMHSVNTSAPVAHQPPSRLPAAPTPQNHGGGDVGGGGMGAAPQRLPSQMAPLSVGRRSDSSQSVRGGASGAGYGGMATGREERDSGRGVIGAAGAVSRATHMDIFSTSTVEHPDGGRHVITQYRPSQVDMYMFAAAVDNTYTATLDKDGNACVGITVGSMLKAINFFLFTEFGDDDEMGLLERHLRDNIHRSLCYAVELHMCDNKARVPVIISFPDHKAMNTMLTNHRSGDSVYCFYAAAPSTKVENCRYIRDYQTVLSSTPLMFFGRYLTEPLDPGTNIRYGKRLVPFDSLPFAMMGAFAHTRGDWEQRVSEVSPERQANAIISNIPDTQYQKVITACKALIQSKVILRPALAIDNEVSVSPVPRNNDDICMRMQFRAPEFNGSSESFFAGASDVSEGATVTVHVTIHIALPIPTAYHVFADHVKEQGNSRARGGAPAIKDHFPFRYDYGNDLINAARPPQ